jgi:nucleotide-binding universal stress UspA family protein
MGSAVTETSRFVVLAALDSSQVAREVLRVAAKFAGGVAGGELHLVHVVEDLPAPAILVPVPLGMGVSATELMASARQYAEQLAAEARARFSGRLSTHVSAGSAWKEILQVAGEVQADLLVVGTHGRGGVKRLLLGSVAEAVVRRACCPVLVAREKDYHAFVSPHREAAR